MRKRIEKFKQLEKEISDIKSSVCPSIADPDKFVSDAAHEMLDTEERSRNTTMRELDGGW